MDRVNGRLKRSCPTGNSPVLVSWVIMQRLHLIEQVGIAKIPTIYFVGGFTASGGLISYGPNLADVYRRVAVHVGKILKGEKPADLPVEQPTKFDS